jgi:phosphatidate cytidylyltransferase
MASSALAQRVATALVLVVVLLPAFVLLPKGFCLALIAAFVLGAAWEWSAFLVFPGIAARLAFVGGIAAAMAVAWISVPRLLPVAAVVAGSLLWWVVAAIMIFRFPIAIGRGAALAAGFLVLVPAWVALVALLSTDVGGRTLLLLALATVWAADVGAYFAGRGLGRVKLAPRVSPGKTWEGAIGGLICSALTAAAGAATLGYPAWSGVPLGLSVGAISIVGDLTVSMFKRIAGLKDSGNLLPGHGGVLDRVDSVTAAAPLFVLEAGWLGWLGS